MSFLEYENEITWDTSVSNGQPRKLSDNSKFLELGWSNDRYTDFRTALKNTCDWFVENYENVRGVAMKTALITGRQAGQDGSYLAEMLLKKVIKL